LVWLNERTKRRTKEYVRISLKETGTAINLGMFINQTFGDAHVSSKLQSCEVNLEELRDCEMVFQEKR